MSYTKDRDRFTRGPGAIAARDNAGRFRKRVALSRASDARDRMLAGYTYGPQGGLSGLGAIKETEMPDDPKVPTGTGPASPPRPRTTVPWQGTTTSIPTRTGVYAPPTVKPPTGVIVDPVPPRAPPRPLPPPIVGPGGVVSGGGGGGGNTGVVPPFVDPPPIMEPPMIPDPPPTTSGGPNLKKIALIGGLLLGGYLLLRNNGTGQ